MVGDDQNAYTRTDGADKYFWFGLAPKYIAWTPGLLFKYYTSGNNEYLNFGGGSSVAPTLKQLSFWASDTGGGTNDAGNEVLRLNATQVLLNTNAVVAGSLKLSMPGTSATVVNLGLASDGTVVTNATPVGASGASAGTNIYVSGSTVSLMPNLTNLTSVTATGSNVLGTATISNLYVPTALTLSGSLSVSNITATSIY